MDYKERFIDNSLTVLSKDLSPEHLNLVRNVLLWQASDFDFIPHKELPSTEVYDFDAIFQHYIAVKKIAGCTENTIKTYCVHIQKFMRCVNTPIQNITTNIIRRYLAIIMERGCKTSYIDDARRIINNFFVFCLDEDYIKSNPCKKISRIRQERNIETPYSDVEITLLKDACKTERDTALISFLLSTGVRREELTKIKVSDINFMDRSVLIHGKGRKDRIVYFSAQCEFDLKKYINSKTNTTEYLFTSLKMPYERLKKGSVANIIKNIGKRANVDNVHLHRFRKWFATHMVNHGVPIQDLKEMMGHSKLDTTNNYYVYSNMERIKYNYRHNAV